MKATLFRKLLAPTRPRGADPRRIALGMCLPLQVSEWALRGDGAPRDFGANSHPSAELCERARRVLELSRAAGVRTYASLRARDVPSLFHDTDVVVLFAHGRADGSIELDDGFLNRDAFVRLMPRYDGHVDLTVCYSEALATPMRHATGALVGARDEPVLLHEALALYLAALERVLEERLPYADAYAGLRVNVMERV